MPFTIIIKKHFSAAHYLKNYHGKCEQLHGHNYQIVVHISKKQLPKSGMLYDFHEIKDYLSLIIPDHKCLNDIFKFNPTTENLAKYFYYKLKKKYPVTKVEVWENETQGSIFS